ncbi:hypothetical protein POM88_024579 [Heracleum sosnowskyi]|uniref:Ubiquitin-like protease family profile domain-containing protein n=1 Tax=Heracleum sosnowskyi TaxID=360622 RepID=A0AAD8MJ08_9APIA|nr:hypothetical protein POM88_024579 [Heracleum sosnowskyi]
MDKSTGGDSTIRRSSRLQQLSNMQSQSEQFMAEESTDSDIDKTPPRVNERLVEGARKDQPEPPHDEPAAKTKNRKWKRKTDQQEKQNVEKKRRKPNVKYATKKGSYAKVDNDEIRNSPRLLSEMLYCLTEEHKQWVRHSGFGELLDFQLEMLPGPFAYNILQIFEHNSVSIRLSNGEINIREEDVSDVLGLPHGGESIMLGENDEYQGRVNEWLSQFSNKDQITTFKVVQQMKGQELTEKFKLNFLIVLSNVLVGTSTNAYVDVKLLRFDYDLDRLSEYNWAEYLLNSLVAAVQSWNRSASVFFNGSLIFLTLLYVDRVRHKGIKLVERQTPSYKGWTEVKLKQRQAIELFSGKFGVGSILPALRDLPANNKNKMKKNVVDENAEQGQYEYADDNAEQKWNNVPHDYSSDVWEKHVQHEQSNEQTENAQGTMNAADGNNYHPHQEWRPWNYFPRLNSSDIWEKDDHNEQRNPHTEIEEEIMDPVEKLRLRAVDLMAAKDKFFEDLKEAKEIYGDDVYLLSIEQVMNEVFFPSTTNGAELVVINERDPSTTNKYVSEVASDFELRPEDIEQLEIMEYLNSTQARIDMPDLFGIEGKNSEEKKKEDIPSFSLGIEHDTISNDIEKIEIAGEDIEEQDAQDIEGEDDDDFVSPRPIVREKSRRLVKVGRYAKSPYIERVIDISAKYTNQDLVIDTWSIILNDNENYKAEESPMRFFCPIGSLHSGLNVNMNVTESYSIFAENMGYTLNRYERKLDNVDMVFFPINKHGHFYLICYNLKKEAFDLIDNIRRKNPKQCYGQTPNILDDNILDDIVEYCTNEIQIHNHRTSALDHRAS